MFTDFQSSAWLPFQNFLAFLPCTSWFSWPLCYRIRSPCTEIFHINWKSYQKPTINSLVRILFNKLSRKKQTKLLFLNKGINYIFIPLVYYLLIVAAEGIFSYPNCLWPALCTNIILSFFFFNSIRPMDHIWSNRIQRLKLLYWFLCLNIVQLSVTTHKKKLKSVSTQRFNLYNSGKFFWNVLKSSQIISKRCGDNPHTILCAHQRGASYQSHEQCDLTRGIFVKQCVWSFWTDYMQIHSTAGS